MTPVPWNQWRRFLALAVPMLGFALLLLIEAVEATRFIQYDGRMKRGLKIGADPLPSEMEYFLRHLSNDITDHVTVAFIKKRGAAVLIQPVPRLRFRGLGVWYVGYVDLSAEQPRIEYRAPISATLWLLAIMLGATVLMWIEKLAQGKIIAPIVFSLLLSVLIVLSHATSKARVRRFIRHAMQTYRG